jgi:hypothetical protein
VARQHEAEETVPPLSRQLRVASGTQRSPSKQRSNGHSQILTCSLDPGAQPQTPMLQVLGKSPAPMQQLPEVSSPPESRQELCAHAGDRTEPRPIPTDVTSSPTWTAPSTFASHASQAFGAPVPRATPTQVTTSPTTTSPSPLQSPMQGCAGATFDPASKPAKRTHPAAPEKTLFIAVTSRFPGPAVQRSYRTVKAFTSAEKSATFPAMRRRSLE